MGVVVLLPLPATATPAPLGLAKQTAQELLVPALIPEMQIPLPSPLTSARTVEMLEPSPVMVALSVLMCPPTLPMSPYSLALLQLSYVVVNASRSVRS